MTGATDNTAAGVRLQGLQLLFAIHEHRTAPDLLFLLKHRNITFRKVLEQHQLSASMGCKQDVH